MTEPKRCPLCGSDLPDNAPAGLCPQCLLQAALHSEPVADSAASLNPTTLTSGFVPPESEELAKHFPHLEILELLGRGGMGAVYKARQRGLDRLVAVKILPPEIGSEPAFAERFTREARALAKLSHQNIVSVFDFGQTDGLYYFVMEYVDGSSLRQLIQTGGLKPEEALAVVPQICAALQFAHDQGIVHRDIKPENILIDRQGRVKIADFGLAKLLGQSAPDTTLTATHQVMGTWHYMAPEQMRGAAAVDHRADIYSLGVVFYELLTGQLPLGRFEPPSKKVQVDVRLDEVVLRSLENEPARRYQQVSDLNTAVSTIASTPPVAALATVPDSVLRPRVTKISLIASGLWAMAFGVLQWGYVSGAEWYFQQELPYDYLNVWLAVCGGWTMAALAWWWYLQAKSPDTPRSFADFLRLLQTPDPRIRGIWLPLLSFGGIAILSCVISSTWGDAPLAICMGLAISLLPFGIMLALQRAYGSRPAVPGK